MTPRDFAAFRSPSDGSRLRLEEATLNGDDVQSGVLVAADGERFEVRDGMADLTWPRRLDPRERAAIELYDARADVYDQFLPLTFSTFGEDEAQVRRDMIALLNLKPGQRVLEIGAGTGRDSEIIAREIGPEGVLHCQDIAYSMLRLNAVRLGKAGLRGCFSLANASHLPFPDNHFDAVFQFGGVGEFSDVPGFFREVARVTRPCGRVVAGDESMPPWLRQTEFARVLTFTNAQFAAPLPLEHLPIEARDVRLRWIIGGTFFLLDFSIGDGEPPADFDFTIPGPRGGTHRSRYYGQLDGVTLETKALAQQARAKLGVSMHDWLDGVVRREAKKILDGEAE
jgi:ubiquinone/menaquinone biosynthesis C-methylase UbiE